MTPPSIIAVDLISSSRPVALERRGRHGRPSRMFRFGRYRWRCATDAWASDHSGVTVFASSEPLTTGPNDLAVLVQDVTSGQPILHGDVEVSARPAEGSGKNIYAAQEPATNRLLEAATLNFGGPGACAMWKLAHAKATTGLCWIRQSK